MKLLKLSLIMVAALLLNSCPTTSDFYGQFDYHLNGLEIGVAFPPLQDTSRVNSTIATCHDLDMKWVRFQESWIYREPSDDSFSWGAMDTRVHSLHDAGIHILLTLGGKEWPAWLGSTGSHNEPTTLAEFREYVAALLARYAGKIDRIQFGNEWNVEIDDYMAGDKDSFISYANILYEEVYKLPPESRPTVVLGSLNGLIYLAADQGLIDSALIEGREPYKDKIDEYLAAPDHVLTNLVKYVFTHAHYDMLDIHLYDVYLDWPKYLQAFNALQLSENPPAVPVIVSEFGGPYPVDLFDYYGGKPDQSVLAQSLPSYVHTLDSMDLQEVYFFSLAEDPSRYHSESFLINSIGQKAPSYEIMRRFGAEN